MKAQLLREFVRAVLSERPARAEDEVPSYVGVKGKPVSMKAGDSRSDALEPEIFDMISKAYEPIGGHAQLTSRADVTDEYPEWIVADIDDDPDPDVVIVGKQSGGGTKVGASGTDGTAKAKAFMNTLKSKVLRNGWWGEVSGAPAYIAVRKLGLKPINDQATVERLLGKKVEWVGTIDDPKFKGIEGWYTRAIGSHKHTKIIVGDTK